VGDGKFPAKNQPVAHTTYNTRDFRYLDAQGTTAKRPSKSEAKSQARRKPQPQREPAARPSPTLSEAHS
jgi:hypothetical protein